MFIQLLVGVEHGAARFESLSSQKHYKVAI